jgi:hypothetical protein
MVQESDGQSNTIAVEFTQVTFNTCVVSRC